MTHGQNAILAALPREVLEALQPQLRTFELRRDHQIYAPHERTQELVFPLSGMISLIAHLGSGDSAEVGIIARESMTGLPVYAGAANLGYRVAVQIPGDAFCLDVDVMVELQERNRDVRQILDRATHAMVAQMAQTAACNSSHDVDKRLARWLLISRDAATTDALELTQEYLATMVGVQRPTVTLAAGAFQRAGLIDYRRGKIRIVDRHALARRSCECYETVREEHLSLMGARTVAQPI